MRFAGSEREQTDARESQRSVTVPAPVRVVGFSLKSREGALPEWVWRPSGGDFEGILPGRNGSGNGGGTKTVTFSVRQANLPYSARRASTGSTSVARIAGM